MHFQSFRQGSEKLLSVLDGVAVVLSVLGDKTAVFPNGDTILAPITGKSPSRERLSGIPLALPKVEQRIRREVIAKTAQQIHGELALRRSQGRAGPFGAIRIVQRDKGRFAAHSQ